MSETADQPDRRPNGSGPVERHSTGSGASTAHAHAHGPDTAPQHPEKADRFRRVAPRRVQVAIEAIGRVGLLAASRYDYSRAEAEQIVCAMISAVEEVAHKLDRTPPPEKKAFAFE